MNDLNPEMEAELNAIGRKVAFQSSIITSEFLLIVLFVFVVAFNRWLEIPGDELQWIGYATGAWTGMRQLIKVSQER